MSYIYGQKVDGTTGWGKPENIISKNLSGNSSATEDWVITNRGSDQIYYKLAGNGNRYYLAKNDPTGTTTTWNEDEAMTVAEWDAAHTQPILEENAVAPPSNLPPTTKTFQITVGSTPEGTWAPIGDAVEVAAPAAVSPAAGPLDLLLLPSPASRGKAAAPVEEMLRRRKRVSRRGRSRRGKSRKVRR